MAGMGSVPPLTVEGTAAARAGRTRARAVLMSFGFALAFSVVAARLVVLGLASGGAIEAARHYELSSAMSRPDILDRDGRILATDIQTGSLFANPRRIVNLDDTADQLAAVLPELDAHALGQRLDSDGQFVWIARELTPSQQADVHELGLPGLDFVQEPHRVYPAGATASHILGFVDVDNRGLAGIETYIDRAPEIADLSRDDVDPGPVRLSVDLSVQHALRAELARALDLYKAKAAGAMVMNVHSGEVLAMASLPDFDPNRREEAAERERFNRMTGGVYELGSVFKIFTVAGALDLGVTTLDQGYDASEPLQVASYTINDFHAQRRWLSVPEIFIYSSNIGSAKMALDIGVDRHRAFLDRLGLLDRASTELGETAAPIVPDPWRRINTMTISYGHGLSVTPLQLAAGAAPLVNGGYKISPTFLKRSREEARIRATRVLKPRTSDLMRYLLRLNVLQGSGPQADAPGYRVGGKTGTAEKVVDGRYSRNALRTTFLGVFPMDEPEYMVLVVLDEPEGVPESRGLATAGANAAPATRRIIERIGPMLSVTPEKPGPSKTFDEHVSASY